MSETDKKTKTVTGTAIVYINKSENRVLNAKNFRTEMICKAADLQSDTAYFSEWLIDAKDLSASEIFNLTEEERTKLRQEFEEDCVDWARCGLLVDWTEHKVEVTVEVEY